MNSRRRFLRRTAAFGAMGIGASLGLPAAKAEGDKPEGDKELRIGVMNLNPYSHIPVWMTAIQPFTRMRVTHCWDIDPGFADGFAKHYGATAVKNFDDMLGKVDGIISGGYYNHPWNHIIHEPYLEAGLPNLVNRPFSNSLAKANKMLELARKHGASIICPSAFEFNNPMSMAKKYATEKKIICYNATNSSDDYATHGIHGVYMVCGTIADAGNPIVAVSFQCENWHTHPGVITYEHKDKEGRRFFGTLHQGSLGLGTVRIHAEDEYGGKGFKVLLGTGEPYSKTQMWAPTLWNFESMARGNDPVQTLEQLEHKHRVYMAGFWSLQEKKGQFAKLDEVPEDWETPYELPHLQHHKTAGLFKKKFG